MTSEGKKETKGEKKPTGKSRESQLDIDQPKIKVASGVVDDSNGKRNNPKSSPKSSKRPPHGYRQYAIKVPGGNRGEK